MTNRKKQIKVDPIKNIADVQAIRLRLKNKGDETKNYRDYCLFVLGTNTGFRAGDLLRIKVYQVQDLDPGDELVMREQKTNKERRVNLNNSCIKAIQLHLTNSFYSSTDYLFKSQRAHRDTPDKQVLHTSSVTRLVKSWCKEQHLKGNYGSHSLRKTFGYHQRVTFGGDLATLTDIFNHSSQKQTLAYLCIQPEEKKNVYMNEI